MTEIWLNVSEVTNLTGESERTVQWKVQTEVYIGKYHESPFGGGAGGKLLKILLTSLPPEAQDAALRERGIVKDRGADGWEKVSEAKREEVLRRLEILAAFERFAQIGKSGRTQARADFCRIWNQEHPEQKVSERTLRNWEKAKKEYGRMGLVPEYGKKTQKNLISPAAWDCFRKMWLQQTKRSVADCYRDLLSVAHEYDWTIPSLRRMQQMAKEIPEAVIVLQREGPDAFVNTCQSSNKRDWSKVPANACWYGDHHRLDFSVKNPNGRGVTRPWFTAWMDARSWKIVGWQLCWTPSGDSILASFRQGALDPTIGLPQEIYIDNGRDYASKEFAGQGHRKRKSTKEEIRMKTTLETLGIHARFAIPGNARAKSIERCFRIFTEQFSKRFSTYCGKNSQERPEQLQGILKSGLVPTMEEAKKQMAVFVKLYNKTASQGEGREGLSPDEVFERERGAIRTASAAALKLCLMRHSQPLKVRMGGIEFMKHQFNNPELIKYRGEKVYIRYDDRDMKQVEVFNLKDEWLLTAELVTAIPALDATKEQIAAANSARKRELEIARELGQVGSIVNPLSPLDQLKIRSDQAADRIADPKIPKVAEIIHVPQALRKAVGQMHHQGDDLSENRRREIEKAITGKTQVSSGVKHDVMSILSSNNKK